MKKDITAYGRPVTVECDERCDLVEWNNVYEGGFSKPDSPEDYNKWCFRACPRSNIIKAGPFDKIGYNKRLSEIGPKEYTAVEMVQFAEWYELQVHFEGECFNPLVNWLTWGRDGSCETCIHRKHDNYCNQIHESTSERNNMPCKDWKLLKTI
jgi:hypothetical protein